MRTNIIQPQEFWYSYSADGDQPENVTILGIHFQMAPDCPFSPSSALQHFTPYRDKYALCYKGWTDAAGTSLQGFHYEIPLDLISEVTVEVVSSKKTAKETNEEIQAFLYKLYPAKWKYLREEKGPLWRERYRTGASAATQPTKGTESSAAAPSPGSDVRRVQKSSHMAINGWWLAALLAIGILFIASPIVAPELTHRLPPVEDVSTTLFFPCARGCDDLPGWLWPPPKVKGFIPSDNVKRYMTPDHPAYENTPIVPSQDTGQLWFYTVKQAEENGYIPY